MRCLLPMLLIATAALLCAPRPSTAADGLWTYRGHAALFEAAAAAKAKNRRLLIGISGGAT